MDKRLAAVAQAYRGAALITFTTLMLFVALNVFLGLAFWVRDRVNAPPVEVDRRLANYHGRFVDLDAYSTISRDEAEAFLDEQKAKGTIGFRFEPWRHFREPYYRGRYLNTDERGFRSTLTPEGKPESAPIDVFVFGGSTTFGYGVPDAHTIPSYLQASLNARYSGRHYRVRNLGQAYYYSSQELALLTQLIRDNEVPHLAVFIDGGNDLSQLGYLNDYPTFTKDLEQMWDERSLRSKAKRIPNLSWIPAVRLGEGVLNRLGLRAPGPAAAASQAPAGVDDSTSSLVARRVEYVVGRYIANVRLRRAICREYGIECLFVWQPHVVYKYDRSLHRTFPFEGAIPPYYRAASARMEGFRDPDFLFLGGMLEGVDEKAYVDDVHYNEATNQRIAERIAAAISSRGPASRAP